MKFARYFLLLGAIIRHTSAAPSPQVLGPKVGIPECPGFEAASPDDFVREWQERKYDDWLDDWWKKHEREFRSKEGGFISAFAMWALGDPHWSCTMDGGPQCSLEGICDNDVLLAKGDDIRPAYFVLKSASNMRTYFQTQKDTFTTAAIEASLKKESWVVDFGLPAEGPNMVTAIKEAVIAAASIVGIIAAFASPAAPAAPFLVGAMMNSLAALAGGAASGLGPTVQPAKDLKFDTAAEIGRELGALLEEMVKKWTMSNNVLMKGQPYLDSGDLRAYVGGGLFINYQKPDQVMLLDKFSDLLTGHAINAMWSKQKSYIIGGRPCDYDYKIQKIDDPQTHYTACIDGRMYYLQAMTYGRKRDKVDKPWGADKLGNENYRNVKIEDAIRSSIRSYDAAKYGYTPEKSSERVFGAMAKGQTRDLMQGASHEGIFTIPVCNIDKWTTKMDRMLKVVETYGEPRLEVCFPLCDDDIMTTVDFLKASGGGNLAQTGCRGKKYFQTNGQLAPER